MNSLQKELLTVGVAVIALMCLLPPWTQKLDFNGIHMEQPLGYYFLFEPPASRETLWSPHLNFELLVLQATVVGVLVGGGLLIFKTSANKSNQPPTSPRARDPLNPSAVIRDIIILGCLMSLISHFTSKNVGTDEALIHFIRWFAAPFVLLSLGFTVIAVLTRGNRWLHLTSVAVPIWWVFFQLEPPTAIVVGVAACVGGGLSYVSSLRHVVNSSCGITSNEE